MKRLVVTRTAEQDLREIARYSETKWGAGQKTRYLDALAALMRRLCEQPSLGLPREEIAPGCRSIASQQHVLFYKDLPETVQILRVLHGNMDFRRHRPE